MSRRQAENQVSNIRCRICVDKAALGSRLPRSERYCCAELQTSATTFATMALLPDARTKLDPSRKYLALCWNGKKDVRAEKLPKPCVTDPVS